MHPENDMYDPNLIRQETGLSKGAILSLVTAKSVMNTYRIMNPDATFFPMIWVDKESAGFGIGFKF